MGAVSSNKVLIGVIDTGIDFAHPEFSRNGGHKIVALWDQLDSSLNNYHFDDGSALGSVYYDTEINQRDCASRDLDGHGTMVASVAAGNTCGLAPQADLVVVKVDYFNFDELMLAYGIDFVKRVAQQRQLPYVISLSYLPKGGAKDGETGVLARILQGELDANLGGGLLKGIVAAAGNENYDESNPCRDENCRMHTHRAGVDDFDLEINTTTAPNDDACILELWYPVENPYELKLTTPSGRVIGPLPPDQPAFREFGEDGFIMITNNRRGMEKWGAIRLIMRDPDSLLAATTTAQALSSGRWNVEMNGESGVWHGYVTHVYPANVIKAIGKKDHTNQFKIRSGGNVRDVVTVGSINNGLVSWRDLFGSTTDYTGCYDPNEISHFSSRGPTKAGVAKPDLYAEGAWIRVASSKDVTLQVNDPVRRKTLFSDEYFMMDEGTSFAAPKVAGAIALMVENDLDFSLTHDRIKYILEETAKRRGKGLGSYLCLDVKRALEISAKY